MRKKKAQDEASGPTGGADAPRSDTGRLSPIDIQQVEFGRAFRGYEEREVDEFLDRLTEDFAAALDEKQRLRDRLDASASGSFSAPGPDDASRRADEIIQRARDDAAALIRDAEARAATAGPIGTADRAAIGAFLSREKEFLQSLAALVQDHAEAVKGMAATARRATAPATPASEPEPEPDQAPAGGEPATEATPSAPAPSATQPMAPVSPGGTAEGRRIDLPDAEASIGSGASGSGQGEGNERSLRELFWGEE